MEEEPQVKVESDIVVNSNKPVPVLDSDEFGVQEEERALKENLGLLEEVETFMNAKINGIIEAEGTEDRKDEGAEQHAGPGHVEEVPSVDKIEPEPHTTTAVVSDETEAHDDPSSEVDEGPQIVEIVNSNARLTSDKEWEDKTQEVEQPSVKEEVEVIKEAEIMEEAPVPSETTPPDHEEQEVAPEPTPMSPEIKEPEEEEKIEPEPEPTVIAEEEEVKKPMMDREPSPSSDAKSIVALNREKFERHTSTDGGGPPNVTYSFKKGGVMASPAVAKEEEPKKSTVKNLRNFFQKLGSGGSKDAEAGDVVTRPGLRNGGGGGAQNRRTMI